MTNYITESWGISMIRGVEVGGAFGRVHWADDYANMAQLEETPGKTMTDEGYRSLLADANDLFIAGTAEDAISYTMSSMDRESPSTTLCRSSHAADRRLPSESDSVRLVVTAGR